MHFLYSGRPCILKKTHPGARGAVDAHGVPGTTGAHTLAQAIAADAALVVKPTTFQVIWGAKRYRQQEIKNAQF